MSERLRNKCLQYTLQTCHNLSKLGENHRYRPASGPVKARYGIFTGYLYPTRLLAL